MTALKELCATLTINTEGATLKTGNTVLEIDFEKKTETECRKWSLYYNHPSVVVTFVTRRRRIQWRELIVASGERKQELKVVPHPLILPNVYLTCFLKWYFIISAAFLLGFVVMPSFWSIHNDHTLYAWGNPLTVGQCLQSSNKLHRLCLTSTALTLDDRIISKCTERSCNHLRMQRDGNLVLYGRNLKPEWSSGTQGKLFRYVSVEDSGKLTLKDFGTSHTIPLEAHTLERGQTLKLGQQLINGDFSMRLEPTRLAIYNKDDEMRIIYQGAPILAALTVSSENGDILLLDDTDKVRWSPGTTGVTGCKLEADGRFIIF